MCAHVAFSYRGMLCGIEHAGYSAPAGAAFFLAIPYLAGILAAFLIACIVFRKTGKRDLAGKPARAE